MNYMNYKCIIRCVDFHECFENFKRVKKVNVMIYIYYNNKITQNATVLYTINIFIYIYLYFFVM